VGSVPPAKPKLTDTTGKLSLQTKNFTLEDYQALCASDRAKQVGYKPEQAVIDRISAPAYRSRWFQRTLTPVNRNIVRAHLQAAVDSDLDVATTVARVQERGYAARNFSGSSCRYCDFASLCRAQLIGGPEAEYPLEDHGLRRK